MWCSVDGGTSEAARARTGTASSRSPSPKLPNHTHLFQGHGHLAPSVGAGVVENGGRPVLKTLAVTPLGPVVVGGMS